MADYVNNDNVNFEQLQQDIDKVASMTEDIISSPTDQNYDKSEDFLVFVNDIVDRNAKLLDSGNKEHSSFILDALKNKIKPAIIKIRQFRVIVVNGWKADYDVEKMKYSFEEPTSQTQVTQPNEQNTNDQGKSQEAGKTLARINPATKPNNHNPFEQ